MSSVFSNHVASQVLGEAAQRGSLDGLRDAECRHIESCSECQHLYGGYRLADRLLAAHWQEVRLPVEAVAPQRRFRFLPDPRAWLAGGLSARSVAPAAIAMGVVLLIGVGVVLPQLMPSPTQTPQAGTQIANPSPSEVASPSQTAAPSAPSAVPTATAGPGKTSGGGGATAKPTSRATPKPTPAATPKPTAGTSSATVITPRSTTPIQGEPIAWAPDGRHLLVAGTGGQIQITDAAGRVTGTCDGDDATWVDSDTVAVAARSGHGSEATVTLVGVNCHHKATLSGTYAENSATSGGQGGMLLGSGHGQLAIADQGDRNASDANFVIWDGHSLSSERQGVPIAWSADGRKLAYLASGGRAMADATAAPSGKSNWSNWSSERRHYAPAFAGSSVSGSLEILSGKGLHTSTKVSGSFSVTPGSPVYGYGLGAVFSPDGRRLVVSGTLVDIPTRTTRRVGQGDWLPDGTLITTSGGSVRRWTGTHSSVEARLPGGGVIETSADGDVIDYFSDGRAPLRLTAAGALQEISLQGVASIDSLLVSPDGKAIAYSSRASGVAAIAKIE
jgi:hypothetical protein